MKTKTINLYEFDELSESAKEKAIQNLSDINVDYEWWDFIFEDAKRIGIKITEFDTDRYCRGEFIKDFEEIVSSIQQEHGKDCDTYKTAVQFEQEKTALVAKYSDGENLSEVVYENEDDFDQDCDELEKEFLKSLLEDYRIMLRKEYEYLTSCEAIIETIKANEYTFTEDGKLENA